MAATPASGFLNRVGECETLDRLVARVRAGQSRVLVLRGEAGIGKTALLELRRRACAGVPVARVAGAEAEMELPFAGLHQLCAAVLDRLARCRDPQQDALNVAFGLSVGRCPRSGSWSGLPCSACSPRRPRSGR